MRQVPVAGARIVSPEEISHFQRELQDQRTLADVLAWLRAQMPPRSVADIVTQDEYSHDVIVQWSDQRYLAFDTT